MAIAHKVSRSLNGITKKGLTRLTFLSVTILLLAAVIGIYRWYSIRQTIYAQSALAVCFEELEKARQSQEQHDWEEVLQSCQIGYQQYPSSEQASYFLALQAEASLALGQTEDAYHIMQEALKKFSIKSPVYYLYAIKNALMMIDSSEESVHQKGVQLLQDLAANNKNPQQDMALFYLGHTFFVQQQHEEAVKIWTQLVQERARDSMWAMKAQQYLETSSIII